MARKTPIHPGYTIVNGSGTGINGSRIDVWVEYSVGAQDIAGNYTPFTAYFYAVLNPDYTSSTANARGLNASFSVDGIAGAGTSDGAYDFSSPGNVHELGHFYAHIAHGSDGTKTLSFSGSFTTKSDYISGGSVTGTVTLPVIHRTSQIQAGDGVITGTSQVRIQRYGSNFTHSIAWNFGSLSGYLTADGGSAAAETRLAGTSFAFRLPEQFYGQIPNAPSDICTLLCRTYSGNTLVGQSGCSFTVSADRSLCAPTLTAAVEDCNPATIALTGDPGVLVRGKSHALCRFSAEAKNGAQVALITVADMPVEGDQYVVENVPSGTVMFVVTDTRGFSTSLAVTLPEVAYVPLTCNPSVKRTDPTSGKAVLTVTGQCYAGHFGAAGNFLTAQCTVGLTTLDLELPVGVDNSYSATVTLSDLDYTESHNVTVTVTDALDTVSKWLTLGKGEPVFDWGEQDFRFHVPVSGAFFGSFQGLYVRTLQLPGTNRVTVQSRYPKPNEDDLSRQSIFLFGSAGGEPVWGLLTVWGSGASPSWSGTGAVQPQLAQDGTVTLTLSATAEDALTAFSADPFELRSEV